MTERLEAHERLRKLSRAVEQSSSIVIITDYEGRIEYVNPGFTRTTGYPVEEVVGESVNLLQFGDTPADFYDQMWNTILAGQVWQGDFKNRKKNGDPLWVIASISPIKDENGEITHFVSSQEDITERRRVEAELVQAQKMEGLGQLVSGVAHDFNNLLTGVVGFTDLCLEMADENDAMRSNLEQISRAGESAMALTRQLLAFSRLQVMQTRVVDLNQVVHGFEGLLRRTISENIELVLETESTLGRVEIDPSHMEQILVNLAVNARDAMPEGGRLTIATSNSDPDGRGRGAQPSERSTSHVCLTVTDTGIGMDDQVKARAFEPFFTTKERGRGTGLGLATVYGIVAQNGGQVEVESETGKGTAFRIFLPRV